MPAANAGTLYRVQTKIGGLPCTSQQGGLLLRAQGSGHLGWDTRARVEFATCA